MMNFLKKIFNIPEPKKGWQPPKNQKEREERGLSDPQKDNVGRIERTARAYLKDAGFERVADKLKGYIQYNLNKSYHEYKVSHLAADVKSGRILEANGIGKVTVEKIKKQLKKDEKI